MGYEVIMYLNSCLVTGPAPCIIHIYIYIYIYTYISFVAIQDAHMVCKFRYCTKFAIPMLTVWTCWYAQETNSIKEAVDLAQEQVVQARQVYIYIYIRKTVL
jgi:hypothetical protein